MLGQLGGFAGQEVLFGSQAFRILGRTVSAKGLSMGVLFVDLLYHVRLLHCTPWVAGQEGHSAIFEERLSMEIDIIIWSDDLAVPTITEKAVDLVPALLRLLDFVRAEFAQRGFQLNLAKGKTGVVATFCGSEAASMRRQYQLIPQPGTIFEFQDGALQFVHMTPSYRHLGTLYTSDQTLDTEISHRVGMARSAFEQIRRRLLTNKHLPLKLFGSLVLSKLFFAAGSWHTPTGRQLDKIRAAIVRMVKSIYGITVHSLSSARLLAQAGILEPRARLAAERLLYAQRLYHHGPAFLQLMTHAEAGQHPFAWLTGLQHDLRWLHGVEAVEDPCLLDPDMTELISEWQRDTGRWKARVRRATIRHIYQETMVLEVQQWHADIFKLLRAHTYTFDRIQPCFTCRRSNTSAQIATDPSRRHRESTRIAGRSMESIAWNTICWTPRLVQLVWHICGVLSGSNSICPTCLAVECQIHVLRISSR